MPRQEFLCRVSAKGRKGECGNLLFRECFMTVVKCPTCGKEEQYEGNEFRPFCSERCKLLDFGAWADEEFRLAADDQAVSEEDAAEIEQALRETERR